MKIEKARDISIVRFHSVKVIQVKHAEMEMNYELN